MTSSTELDVQQAHLVKMANQIAANAPVPSAAAAAVATHLRTFWTPAMRQDLLQVARERPDLLWPQVIEAVQSPMD